MNDAIAEMYPVNIPPPSRVGSYTYGRFLTETPIIRDARYKQMAISKIEKDMEEFKQMRLHSDLRNPPLDERGIAYRISKYIRRKIGCIVKSSYFYFI